MTSPWASHDPANPADRAEVETYALGVVVNVMREMAKALDALTYGEWDGADTLIESAGLVYPKGGVGLFMLVAIDLAQQLVQGGLLHAEGAECVVHLERELSAYGERCARCEREKRPRAA